MLGRYPVSLAKVLALLFSLTLTACGGGGGSDSGGSVTPDVSFQGKVVDEDALPLAGVLVELPVGSIVEKGTTNADGVYTITITGAQRDALEVDLDPNIGVVVSGSKPEYLSWTATYTQDNQTSANFFTLGEDVVMKAIQDNDVILDREAPANFTGSFIRLGDGLSSGNSSEQLQTTVLHGESATYSFTVTQKNVDSTEGAGVTNFRVSFRVLGLDNADITRVTLQEVDGVGGTVGLPIDLAILEYETEGWVAYSIENGRAPSFDYNAALDSTFELTFSTSPIDENKLDGDFLDDSEIAGVEVKVF
jgi:hypothetical protein